MDQQNRRQVLFSIGIGSAVAIGGGVLLARSSPAEKASPVRPNLYNCEGCEAVVERPSQSMLSTVQLATADEPGERMILSGRATLPDGAAAANVVIYAHHTNVDGLYANGTNENEWSRRHGRLRGWAKTDADGNYRFNTIKPAPYPDMTMPAHVHLYIGEPDRRPYYIDDVVFDGEYGVTGSYRAKQEFRGGGGIVKLEKSSGGIWLARRDIKLERHV